MKYLKISNKGILDPKALSLVGASTKREDEKTIGQFGSGNKFALAYLLRNDYETSIYAGKDEIPVKLIEEKFRDKPFKVLNIAGNDTSITTEMGKDWELWQAIREIYCNALDEGEASIELTNKVEPEEDETHFYIKADDEVREFVSNFSSYFSETKRVLFECKYGKILEKDHEEKACIYRKGVKCFITKKKSAYDYDFNSIEINESRIVEYNWHIPEKLWKILKQCDDREIILKILKASGHDDYIESELGDNIASIYSSNMSDGFKNVVKSTNLAPKEYAGMLPEEDQLNHIMIPYKVFKQVQEHLDEENTHRKFNITNNALYREIEMKPLWEQTLRQVYDFLDEVGYNIPYDVKAVKFNKKNTLGSIKGEQILIADVCFERGMNEVLNTMIEEYIHIKHGVQDETRGMQAAIISEFITYMKNKNAYAI